MNLLQIRQQLIKTTGRYDLATESDSIFANIDAGADAFINSGSRYLDLLQDTEETTRIYPSTILAGGYSITVPNVRTITGFNLVDTEEGKLPVEFMQWDEFIAAYPKYADAEVSSLTDLSYKHWSIEPISTARTTVTTQKKIVLSAPVESATSCEVIGDFYSDELVNQTDQNYWSINFPLLLVAAAQREIEALNRNTQGVKDMDAYIERTLINIDKDLANWVSATDLRMRG